MKSQSEATRGGVLLGPRPATVWTGPNREAANAKRDRKRNKRLRAVRNGGVRSTVGTGLSGAPSFVPEHRPTRTPWKSARTNR